MYKITEFFVKRPILFWSLIIGITLGGLFSYIMMPKLEDPEIPIKQAMVVVTYPGATAHEVEMEAVTVVEEQIRTMPGLKKVTSQCENGIAYITAEFQLSVPKFEIEQRFDLLRRKMNDCKNSLPQGCYAPIVIDDMLDIYGMFYSLSSNDYSPAELNKYAKYLKRELLKVDGVKRISLYGTRQEVVDVIMSKENVQANGLTPMLIMQSLNQANKKVDAGNYTSADENISIHVSGAVNNEKQLADMLITTPSGKQVHLGDIATIKRGYVDPQRNGLWVNGEQSIGIMISAEPDANVTVVGQKVDEKLQELMKNAPAGMQTDKIFFQPDKVNEAISGFMINLLESVLIVIVVLIFAMGWKSGVIIGVGLILTIAASFPVLLVMGTTLQRISLGAFIIAMGMLVDNSIVIMDGILVDRAKGLAPKQYLYNIVNKTALPLLGATVIAASTLLAVAVAKGSASEYASDLFWVMCVSLLLSWVFAIVQVPMFAKVMFKPRPEGSSSNDQMNTRLHRLVKFCASWCIDHKAVSIGVAVVLLTISLLGFSKVRNLFFPDFSYKQFVIEYYMPAETNPDKVRDDLLAISKQLKNNPAIERIAVSTGATPGRYCLVRPINQGGDYYGELIIDCKDYDTVKENIWKVRDKLRREYPDAMIRARKYNFSISSSHTVEARFLGPDPAVLRQLSAKAEDIMRSSPYVDKYSVENDWMPQGKALNVDFIRQNGLGANIRRSDIGNALQAAGDGMIIGLLNDWDTPLQVKFKVRNADGSRIKNIKDVPVWGTVNPQQLISKAINGNADEGMRGASVSSVISEVKPAWDERIIKRVNGQRAIEAECDPDFTNPDATPAKALADVQDKIEAISLPDGYSMTWAGEGETAGNEVKNVLSLFPISVFVILVVLLFLFNSWKKLGTILLCFPFVFTGIVPAMLITGSPFTFMALLGFFGLVGMMIKNAIVLVDEITRLIKEEKLRPFDAVINAAVSRTRPVLMASLTTIVGMAPLIGDAMYGSMAVLIISGLTLGTITTLVVVPLVYASFYKIKSTDV